VFRDASDVVEGLETPVNGEVLTDEDEEADDDDDDGDGGGDDDDGGGGFPGKFFINCKGCFFSHTEHDIAFLMILHTHVFHTFTTQNTLM